MAPRIKRAVLKSKEKGKGTESSRPLNPYGIIFRNEIHKSRYNQLVERRIINTKYADRRTLDALGFYEDVVWMFERIGSRHFFEMTPPTYMPLVLEFLSSLTIDVNENADDLAYGEFIFRLANAERKLTLAEVRSIYQFAEGFTEIHSGFLGHVFWNQITSEAHFAAITARASKITNPCIKYAHRVLAHTIFGRGDSDGMVRQIELYLLWGMLSGVSIDVAYFLVKHLDKVAKAKKGAMVIGGLVTPIALYLGIEPYGVEIAKGNPRLNMESCIAMRMIVREGDVFCLSLGPNVPTLPLPNIENTTVRKRANWKLSPSAAQAAFTPPL